MRKLLAGRRLDASAERVLFALVANRALAPSSKLAAARWVNEDVLVAGLPATSDDACYRAMDWLTEIKDDLERKVFDNLADLLNLEVDLLFFDYPAKGYSVNRTNLKILLLLAAVTTSSRSLTGKCAQLISGRRRSRSA
jgi:hypothetical protein